MNALSDERRVLTYGAFDPLGAREVRFLRRLAGMGDRLIVGLASDKMCATGTGSVLTPYDERREVLLACRYVDQVIAAEDFDQAHSDIVNYNIALFVMSDAHAGQFDDLIDLAQVLYVPEKQPLTLRVESPREQKRFARSKIN